MRSRWLRFWTKALLRLPHIFSPIYTLPPSSYSLISNLLILERELVAFAFARLSFASVSLLLKPFLSKPFFSRGPFTCKFFLILTLHYFALVERFLSEDVNLGT